jgi:hypothetical protein
MRNLLRLGLIILLAAIGGAAAAPVALAGGPTSVLIASPANQRTSSAYTGDARYQRLATAVGIDTGAGIEQPTSGESPPVGIDQSGAAVRLTWLIHDMAVWRVDRIHLSDDTIWIHTTQHGDQESGDEDAGVWHRAADPAALRAAITETGVLRRPAASADPSSEPTPSTAPATTSAEQSAVPGGAPPAGLIGAAGAALGIVLGVAATLLTQRVRRHPDTD